MGCVTSSPETVPAEQRRHSVQVQSAKPLQPQAVRAPPSSPAPKSSGPAVHTSTPITERYILKKVLGKGAFAVCRLATEMSSKNDWAVKIINLAKLNLSTDRWMVDNEVEILRKVHHPNIVSLHEIFLTATTMSLVLDLCRGGELFEEVVKRGHFSEEDVRRLMVQIFSAVGCLHNQGVIHRDIKPENLLLTDTTASARVQLTDFGLSGFLKKSDMSLFVGTPQYMAPEMFDGHTYGPVVDIWSCGVVMFVLLAGYLPFDADDEKALSVLIHSCKPNYGAFEKLWSKISPSARDLLNKIFVLEPSARLTAEQALRHPWLTSVSSDVHLADTVSNLASYNARRKLKAAMTTVLAIKRMTGALNLLAHSRSWDTLAQGGSPTASTDISPRTGALGEATNPSHPAHGADEPQLFVEDTSAHAEDGIAPRV